MDNKHYRAEKRQSYLKMYDAALEGALKANPNIKIGGPAGITPRGHGISYIEPLIKHCAESRKQLDFVSWHIYYEQPILYKNEIQWVRHLLDKYGLKNVELIIDEWDTECIPFYYKHCEKDKEWIIKLYEGNFKAAFVAATLQTMVDSKLDVSVFWPLRQGIAIPVRVEGLVIERSSDHSFIKRPAWYAFKMFNMLYNKRIEVNIDSRQNIGAIATISDDEKYISLLIWTYDPLERIPKRNIRIKLPFKAKKIKYDRYLIDSNHTLLGAEKLEMVEEDVIASESINLTLQTNSVTLLKIKLKR
jgi:hypothetical protein